MKQLPDSVRSAWKKREGPLVLATVDHGGLPNAIYATCVRMLAATWLPRRERFRDFD